MVTWTQDAGRIHILSDGTRLPLHMTENGLGWLGLREITDPDRLRALVAQAGLTRDFEINSRDAACMLNMVGPESLIAYASLLEVGEFIAIII